VPEVEVNAACPGYNQHLKVSTTEETVTNNGAVLQQITQNFKDYIPYYIWRSSGTSEVQKVRIGF